MRRYVYSPAHRTETRRRPLEITHPRIEAKYENFSPGWDLQFEMLWCAINRCGVQVDYDSPPGDRHTASAQ